VTGDCLYLGWQYAAHRPEPGPPPRRPTPPPRERVDPGWVAAQRAQEGRHSLPVKIAGGLAVTACVAAAAAGLAGVLNPVIAAVAAAGAALVAAVSANALRQGRAALTARLAAERRRIDALRTESERRLFESQAEHASRVRDWQHAMAARAGRPSWYAVRAPAGITRVDLAGGTLPGWSALVTMTCAYRLAAGGAVTVLDLTQACVAADLLSFAAAAGYGGQVLVLPRDLAELDLAAGLRGAALADVLAGSASDGDPGAHLADDAAILRRVTDVLGGEPSMAAVTAALRVLAAIGDPAEDISAGLLTPGQADRLRVLFGPDGAGREAAGRAWALESRLSVLAGPAGSVGSSGPAGSVGPEGSSGSAGSVGSAGSAALHAPAGLRVVAVARDCSVTEARVLATYVVGALAHRLRQAEPGPAWRHTVLVLGAERLPGDQLDRLCDACEAGGTGLLLGYRTIGPQVAVRLGRGNAAIAFMRLGNAQEAKVASEQLGTEHRFVLAALTETVGLTVTDTTGGSYTSTAGRSGSVSGSRSASSSRSRSSGRGRGPALLGGVTSRSDQVSDGRTDGVSASVSAGISESTAWGRSTSAAAGVSATAGSTAQRSREMLVEQHELQQLPPSAMIVTYASPAGREVIFADANPAIGTLPGATLHPPKDRDGTIAVLGGVAVPNLGPPPVRLDWRR
jgi:hypothetical protein